MLERLTVHGLGIIDGVDIEFESGFTALTGETGAGKSLLVESLKLLAGSRASTDLVRTGEDRLRVEGWFVAPDDQGVGELLVELGVEPEDELVIRREVTASGRSRCWLNGVAVTAGSLQRLAPLLLAIHGQHEQYGLADPVEQRRLVDRFGGLESDVERLGRGYAAWNSASAEVGRLAKARGERRDRFDAIAFQLAEIEAVNPQPGEVEDLGARRRVLQNAARLRELATEVVNGLGERDEAVVATLARCERRIGDMESCGLQIGEAAEQLREARVLTEDVLREIDGHLSGFREDPRELDEVESRLNQLEHVLLKYGGTIAEVLGHRDSLLRERDELLEVGDRLEEARTAAETTLSAYDAAAARLDEKRRSAARQLVKAVQNVLADLEMAGTQIDFRWVARPQVDSPLRRSGEPVAFDADGVEEAEILLAANPGEAPKPMSRIASGGELSRLHLALRSALRQRGPSGGLTLLFDEVDSGLGGRAAAALAGLLAALAQRDQVLVVTHLAAVAARASSQSAVEKVVNRQRTVTRVRHLDRTARVEEVARMLAGSTVSTSAREHAREMIDAENMSK